MRVIITTIALCCCLSSCQLPTDATEPHRTQPNIVFIMVDDMGYADLSCYDSPDAKTPNIDRLAKQGVRFTQYYANGAECTPTRTALLTGRYTARFKGMECAIGTGNVGRYDDAIEQAKAKNLGLEPSDAILPSALTNQGYATAIFGKWHLGYEPKFNPLEYGFDRFFGVLGGNCDYFTHKELSPLPVLYRDRGPVQREGYMTHLITADAVDYVRASRDKPYFLYVPYTTPHFPFQTPTDTETVYTSENFTRGTRAAYVTMLEDMDKGVGEIIQAIDEEELTRNTVVFYCSDHGAMKPGLNTPFNGYKGGLFEGGIRAPLIVRWPGHITPGSVSKQTAITMDLTKSMLRIGGADTSSMKLDGIDIVQHVERKRPDVPRKLFWRARRGDRTWRAVRDGDMKYIWKTEEGKIEEWLFDLADDIGEKSNLIASNAGDADRLRATLKAWEDKTLLKKD